MSPRLTSFGGDDAVDGLRGEALGGDGQREAGVVGQAAEPEVAEAVGGGRAGGAVRSLERQGRAFHDLLGGRVVEGAGHELLRDVEVVHPRLRAEFGLQHLSLGDEVGEVRFLTEQDGFGGAGVRAARDLPLAAVQQVRATGAFLRQVEVLVEVDDVVRAGIHAVLAAGALVRVDDHEAVFALVDARPRSGRTGCREHRRSAGRAAAGSASPPWARCRGCAR